MSSISCARTSDVAVEVSHGPDAPAVLPAVLAARAGNIVRLLAVAFGAASLAACAQSSVVSKNSGFFAGRQQASHDRHSRVASAKKHTPFARRDHAAATTTASQGVASFYTEGTQTAIGEKFNTHELTAAHPTLPFGTRLRVTNVASG